MKLFIDVKDEEERDRIATALCDPQVRVLVNVMGTLLPLNERQRAAVLNKVAQQLELDL